MTLPATSHPAIIQCAYQLALKMHQISGRFPRDLRHSLGSRLVDTAHDVLEVIVRANATAPRSRADILDHLPHLVLAMRLRVRMAADLRAMSTGQAAALNTRIEDLSKQLAGWRRWSAGGVTPRPAPAKSPPSAMAQADVPAPE